MRHHLDAIVVAIISDEEGHSREIGSGTCINLNGRYFILTAGHVLRDALSKGRGIGIVGRGQPNPLIDHYRGIILDDILDLGWIEIDTDDAEILRKSFISIERLKCSVQHLVADPVMICGYPAALISIHSIGDWHRLRIQPLCFQTVTIEPDAIPDAGDKTSEIFIKYPETGIEGEEGQTIELPEPYGISGGGIWVLNAKTKGPWSPDKAELIGIEHSWSESHRYLRGTQVQYGLDLIASRIPDLAPLIRHHIGS